MTVTVLVIDDSLTYREELRRLFEGAGYAVSLASSGEEGLRIAALERPSAIVVDGVLPGVDGPGVIRRVRLDVALRSTPCLLLTGSDDATAELRALDAGADAFVRKADELDVVLARLAAILRTAVPPSLAPGPPTPLRLLAVDDDPSYLYTLAASLELEGYEVETASSAEEALEVLSARPVDCILLDLVMPGMGGHEACLRIKAAPVVREIPLLILTGRDDRQTMLDGLAAGADDFVQKSGDTDVLKARVRSQIRRKQFEEENRKIRVELLRQEREATEARAARQLYETRTALVEELERKNKELEAFSYSVSHDLRAPLRSIDGFSQALAEDHADRLDAQGLDYLRRVRAAAQRMGDLIDDLLELSRVGRAEMQKTPVDLTGLSIGILEQLKLDEPQRRAEVVVAPGMEVDGDRNLLKVALDNLLGNAWKFTSKKERARIEVGMTNDGRGTYFVKDDGAGFSMTYVSRLFAPFQRLHHPSQFEGTGVGLATVRRIIERHGGRIWAEASPDHGATFFFTLAAARPRQS